VPDPQDEGSAVTFTDTSTSYPDSIVFWDWDFAGLNTSSQQHPQYTFMDDGTYTVTLTVTDDDGSTHTVTHDITIGDVAPTAEYVWSPAPQAEGSPVQFTDNSSSYPDSIVSWDWDFAGLGSSKTQNPQFTFMSDGGYDVTLIVTDDDGSTGTIMYTVIIVDIGPTAEFTWPPGSQKEGTAVQFTDKSASYPDDLVSWSWDFGDGTTGTAPNQSHTYGDNGVFTVTLTVTDDDGSADSISYDITIDNVAPTLGALPSLTIDEGDSVFFNCPATDPGSDDLTFEWTWEYRSSYDKTTTYLNNPPNPDPYPSPQINPCNITDSASCQFGDNGVFLVTLIVTDDDGGVTTVNASVTVINLAPTVDALSSKTIDEGDTASFTGHATDFGSDDLIFEWTWEYASWGDKTTIYYNNGVGPDPFPSPSINPRDVTESASCQYGDNGIFTVTLTVTDDDGATTTVSTTVTVNNVAPEVDDLPEKTINEYESVTFTGHATDMGSDDLTFEWTWEYTPWGDKTTTYYNDGVGPDPFPSPSINPRDVTESATCQYGDNGVFTVTLTVTDDDGVTTTVSTTVTVNNVAPTVEDLPEVTIDEYESVTFTGHATDPGSDDLTFEWTWEYTPWGDKTTTYYNDGVGPDPYPSPPINPRDITETATCQYGDNGVFTVTLTVTDDDGATTTVTTEVTVNNIAPTVEDLPEVTIDEYESVTFTGHATDPGSDDLTFEWTWDYTPWGDKTTTYYSDGVGPDSFPSPSINPRNVTETAKCQYGDNGVFTVTLTVTDDDGSTTTVSTTVTVNNVAPTVDSLPAQTINEYESVTFTGHATDPGSDDLIFEWTWEYTPWGDKTTTYYNDGTGPDPYPSPSINPRNVTETATCQYGDNGVFTVTLTVTDDDGASTTASTTVTVYNVAPIIAPLAAYTTYENSPVIVSGIVTDVGSDDLTITWDWGDGTNATITIYYNNGVSPDPFPSPEVNPMNITDSVSHIYGDDGVFMVTLTVEDDDGDTLSSTTSVTVNNVAPKILPFGPFTVDEGMQLNLSATATDPGSDDLTFTWEFELGPTKTKIYYNNGVSPDPYPSPEINPRNVTDDVDHTYGDNYVYTLTLTVEDDDGGVTVYITTITVNNVAPTIDNIEAYIMVNFTLRIAGEKWHDVKMYIYADDEEIAYGKVVRYPGNPDDQLLNLGRVKCDVTKTINATLIYTPDDDPVNGQKNGATPAWVILSFDDGEEKWIKHTFNVRHPDTWKWNIYINPYFVGHAITFEANATDQGSDDLTFNWNWNDSTPDNNTIYYNDGMNPDPYPSPWGTYPFMASDEKKHTFTSAGNYDVTLTVTDDDGGVTYVTITLKLN
jgi:PKD repeat protein